MMRTLLIDDERQIEATIVARTYSGGLKALLEEGPFDVLYLDHDLGAVEREYLDGRELSGYDICVELERMPPEKRPFQVELVTMNPVGLENMARVLSQLYMGRSPNKRRFTCPR